MKGADHTESLASRAFAETPAETPRSWRVAALGILTGGAVLGLLAGHRSLGRVMPLMSTALALGCAVPVAVGSRRPPITPQDAAAALHLADRKPTFSIVVGARDEALVLRQLVADVGRLDYMAVDGEPLFELVVVDDRSTDGTAEIAKAAAAQTGIAHIVRVVLRRGEGLRDGKGAALTAAQPDICNGDVVLVLDADARLEPSFLRHAAGYFAAGAHAVTARRRILDAGSSWLAGAQADEQTLDGELNRGRWAMGGCSEFRGNGLMIRRDLLERAGGWRAAVTEDIDLSSRIAAVAGERVVWALDAEVWEEPVRSAGGLWQQRLRWAEGAVRRAFEQGPAVVTSHRLPVAARLDFVAYVGLLAVPAVVAGATVSAAVTGRRRSLVSMIAGYLGVSALLGWDALRWERGLDGRPLGLVERARRTVRVSLFNSLWLLVVPRALVDLAFRRGPIRYTKMEHDGAGDPAAPSAQGRPAR